MSGTNRTTKIEPLLSAKELEKAARERINNQAELYRSLVRALKRRRGFGILFVQCTPAKGKEIFSRLETDLTKKQIGKLTLTKPIDNLKELIEARADLKELNILFIEGIEQSLLPYTQSEFGRNDYYKLEVLPPILDHLNLHRENFRNQFGHLCLVFVVPAFALKHFIYRAVDFFSWHSGIWTFSPPEEELAKDTASALAGEFLQYLALSDAERSQKLIHLQNMIDVKNQSDERKADLLWEQGMIFAAAEEWDSALRCFDSAGLICIDDDKNQFFRGFLLSNLNRPEEAIVAYDNAIAIKPDFHQAFYNKGVALAALGRTKEAITAYDDAIAIKPDYHQAFYNKGVALSALGRTEEAVAAYDDAIAIKPDYHQAFYNKGVALSALGRTEEAIAAYDNAIAIKPDKHEAFSNKGVALSALGRTEEAIAAYDDVIAIKPDDHQALYNKACSYALSHQLNGAIASLQKAIALDNTNHYIEMAKTDTDFDAIRDRPQFQAFLAQQEKVQASKERSPNP